VQRTDALAVLRSIREAEIEIVISAIQPGATILEVGAGAGWQARYLTRRGFRVIPIDLAENYYAGVKDWPVIPYDGANIPLRDAVVDVVFSSNVLEHVARIENFSCELRRVLKPDGKAIHLMPTPSWRFWTSVAIYPEALRKVWGRLMGAPPDPRSAPAVSPAGTTAVSGARDHWWRHLAGNLWPARHGERGNTVSELYYFSSRYWIRLFESTGWKIVSVRPNRLLYTGYFLLGKNPSLRFRRSLAKYLGSSCYVYALVPDGTTHLNA
jgi:SAM-dependent methyltransferase